MQNPFVEMKKTQGLLKGNLSHNLRVQIKFKYCANTKKKYGVFGIANFPLKWYKSEPYSHLCKRMAKRKQIGVRTHGFRFVWANMQESQRQKSSRTQAQSRSAQNPELKVIHRMIRVVFIWQFCMRNENALAATILCTQYPVSCT